MTTETTAVAKANLKKEISFFKPSPTPPFSAAVRSISENCDSGGLGTPTPKALGRGKGLELGEELGGD